MKIIVAFGDMRFAYAAAFARADGFDAYTYGLERAHIDGAIPASMEDLVRADAVICPNLFAPKLQAPLSKDERSTEELLSALPNGAQLLHFGMVNPPDDIIEKFRLIDLSTDETLTMANARYTAEGAIAACMARLSVAMMDANCLIIGYGRIGHALCERLVALGAKVTVAARREEARKLANQRGANAISLEEMQYRLNGFDCIFSTPPERVLEAAQLARIRGDAMVIDLSSPPYGVDFSAAERLGVNAWLEPALPGRYCPKSAGWVLWQAAKRQFS